MSVPPRVRVQHRIETSYSGQKVVRIAILLFILVALSCNLILLAILEVDLSVAKTVLVSAFSVAVGQVRHRMLILVVL